MTNTITVYHVYVHKTHSRPKMINIYLQFPTFCGYLLIKCVIVLFENHVHIDFGRIIPWWYLVLVRLSVIPFASEAPHNVCMYVLYYFHSLESIYKYRTHNGKYKQTNETKYSLQLSTKHELQTPGVRINKNWAWAHSKICQHLAHVISASNTVTNGKWTRLLSGARWPCRGWPK